MHKNDESVHCEVNRCTVKSNYTMIVIIFGWRESTMDYNRCIKEISDKNLDNVFSVIYGYQPALLERQRLRYIHAIEKFHELFPVHTDIRIYSAPGRTEIGGNHTDHQRGVVLAGAVDFDIIAIVAFHEDGVVRVISEGYEPSEIHLDELLPKTTDDGTTKLVKGIVTKFKEKNVSINGFDMYTVSDVISGGGISSSAAFETLVATIIDKKYNDGRSTPFEIAQCGWFAENKFFGKKCGLLDQTVSAYGGLISIDFKDENNPIIERIPFDFEIKDIKLYYPNPAYLGEELSVCMKEVQNG